MAVIIRKVVKHERYNRSQKKYLALLGNKEGFLREQEELNRKIEEVSRKHGENAVIGKLSGEIQLFCDKWRIPMFIDTSKQWRHFQPSGGFAVKAVWGMICEKCHKETVLAVIPEYLTIENGKTMKSSVPSEDDIVVCQSCKAKKLYRDCHQTKHINITVDKDTTKDEVVNEWIMVNALKKVLWGKEVDKLEHNWERDRRLYDLHKKGEKVVKIVKMELKSHKTEWEEMCRRNYFKKELRARTTADMNYMQRKEIERQINERYVHNKKSIWREFTEARENGKTNFENMIRSAIDRMKKRMKQ